MLPARWTNVLSIVVIVIVSFLELTCTQYPYDSPLPGILEVRLKVANNRQILLPFGPIDSLGQPRNTFGLLLNSLHAARPGGVQFEIFSDLAAIRRNPDGDRFNCLDTMARDGMYILGKSYAPPETYTGLNVRVTPDPGLSVLAGAFPNFLEVRPLPPAFSLDTFLAGEFSFNVQEGRLTRITVVFDLDLSLIRRVEWFEYTPNYFYVVENF